MQTHMAGATAHFNADQMALIAHTPRPLLLRFGKETAGANADHTIVVVMPPGPVLKEGPHQVCKALFVCSPKALQGLDLIKVVTIPLSYRPIDTNFPNQMRHTFFAAMHAGAFKTTNIADKQEHTLLILESSVLSKIPETSFQTPDYVVCLMSDAPHERHSVKSLHACVCNVSLYASPDIRCAHHGQCSAHDELASARQR